MRENSIDVMGKVCPYPVTVTLKALREMDEGDVLKILTNDPLAIKAIPEEIRGAGFETEVEKIVRGWSINITKV